jgi:hypothetical protein
VVARGKLTATAGITPGEKSLCTGKVEVTAKLISGQYTCKGVTSYDPATSKMGKVVHREIVGDTLNYLTRQNYVQPNSHLSESARVLGTDGRCSY